MTKRQGTLNDIAAMVEFRKKQLIDEGAQPIADIDQPLVAYFYSAIKDGSLISWVMEDDGEIIATSGICFYQLPPTYSNPSGRVAYITNMYTKDEYRRRGIAAELLEAVIEEAKKRDYKLIRLHTSDHGRSIYEKAGFTDTDGFMALRF